MKICRLTLFFLLVGAVRAESPNFDIFRRVTAEGGLILRAEPSVTAAVRTVIPEGAFVRLISSDGPTVLIAGKSGVWCKLRFGKIEGWAFGAFLNRVDGFIYESTGKVAPVLNHRLHESLDCTGLSYSEYAADFIFKPNGEFEYSSVGAIPIACNSPNMGGNEGLNGTSVSLVTGRYTIEEHRIVVRNLKGFTTYSQVEKNCKYPPPGPHQLTYPEKVEFFPVICTDSAGAAYPAVVSSNFGYSALLVWVFNKAKQ